MSMMELLHMTKEDLEPKKPTVINISREDFGLLEVEENATYYITEADGTITIRKGENA